MATPPLYFSGNESKLISLGLNERALPACPGTGNARVMAGTGIVPCSPCYAGWLAPGVGSSSSSMRGAERVSECKIHEF